MESDMVGSFLLVLQFMKHHNILQNRDWLKMRKCEIEQNNIANKQKKHFRILTATTVKHIACITHCFSSPTGSKDITTASLQEKAHKLWD